MAAMRLLLLLIGLLSYVTLTRQQYVVAPVRSARRSLLQTAALVALERCLGSDIEVLDRSDADYEIVRLRTSQASVLSRFPSVYIRPSSGEQVRRVMRCLNKGDVPFVVRSGGHSYRGLTILNCGAVVDLGRLQHFRMIDNGKAAWVQAGHRLGPLYRKLWLAGEKIFPAGACPSVGLSGLLAAGGQGALTRYLSMSVDSVLGALVITPDGNLRYASPTSNRDLYFAIRGGTGGYGIVTRWKLRVHQAPKVFTSLSIDFPWSEESLKFVLGKFFDAKPWNWPNKLTLVRFFIGWLYGDKVGGDAPFRLVLNYWGPKKELDAFIKKTPFFKQVSYEVTRYVEGTYLQEMLHQAKIGWWDKTYTTVDDFTDKVVTDAWYDLKPIIWRGPGTTAASAYFGKEVPQAAVDFISEQMYSRKSTNLLFTVLRGASTKATLGPSGYDVHRSSVVNVEFLDDYSNGVASGEAWVRTMLKGMSPYTTGLQYYGYIHDIPKGMDPFSLFFGKKNGRELRKIWEKYDPKKLLYPFSLPKCK